MFRHFVQSFINFFFNILWFITILAKVFSAILLPWLLLHSDLLASDILLRLVFIFSLSLYHSISGHHINIERNKLWYNRKRPIASCFSFSKYMIFFQASNSFSHLFQTDNWTTKLILMHWHSTFMVRASSLFIIRPNICWTFTKRKWHYFQERSQLKLETNFIHVHYWKGNIL